MKFSKRVLSLIISLIMVLTSFSVLSVNADEYDSDYDMNGSTVIVYTSNLRGDIDTLSKIARIKSDFESEGADVVLVDTGNFLQGTLYASADKGYTVLSLMELVGYDVVALGKYDFVFGDGVMGAEKHGTLEQYFTLSTLLNGGTVGDITKPASSIKAISSNAVGKNAYFTFDGNMTNSALVTTKSGRKIGFTALTNPGVKDFVLESSLDGISFTSGDKMYSSAKSAAQKLSADTVVCLSNTGSTKASDTGATLTIDVKESDTPTVGMLLFNKDNKLILKEKIDLYAVPYHKEIKEIVDSKMLAISEKFPAVSKSSVVLNGSQSAVRSTETNLGDFWCDALKWFAVSGNINNYYSNEYRELGYNSLQVSSDKVVSIWNGGNLRDYLYDGDVIIQDLERVLPYPNKVAVVYVTGAQLLEALEAAMQYDAAFPSVAGLVYNIEPMKNFEKGTLYKDSKYYAPKTINKITISSVNGKAFDKNAKYCVITNNLVANGGDTYGAFLNKAKESTIVNIKVTAAVWMYIEKALGGDIGDTYASTAKRITKNHIHTLVTDKAVSATYAKAGKTQGSHCSVCKKVITPQKTVAKLTVAKPKSIKIKTLKKGFKLSWAKQSKATGYQIQYSTSKNFKKSVKTVWIKKNSTKSYTKSKLSAKKKYYVRIRAYKTYGGKKYYSAWTVKTVTTKK